MLHLLSSFKLMFFKTKSKKSHQNKYLPRFGKLYSLKFPQLHSSRSVTWGRYTARKASLREFFSLFNEPFCLQMNFVTAGCWFFNLVNLGQATFKIQKVGRDGYIRSNRNRLLIHRSPFWLYNFILSIHRGNPKQTPCSLLTFSRRFTVFPFQKIKNLALLEVQIYISTNKECKLIEWQAARLTSSFDFLSTISLSTSNYIPDKRYLSSLHFMHLSM